MSKFNVAIIYDFDGTLARGNLQERSFIPDIGMTKEDFWKEVQERAKIEDADEILVYMNLMLRRAAKSRRFSREELEAHGKKADLFSGLEKGDWFKRINKFGKSKSLNISHYIVSSGIEEMIKGCSISQFFSHIFASKFIYNDDGLASWPGNAVNYTTKTQYLFRINKGIMNTWDHRKLNSFMPEYKRATPFENMIFIGDGDTDVPTMKMLNYKGGTSIAVYEEDEKKVHNLIADGRVNFVAPADYREGSPLEIQVKGAVGRISRSIEEGGFIPPTPPAP
ncbi:MAG: HAD family hydrolase [Glycocaulis sp.]